MKKILTSFLMLAALLCSATSWAQSITVAGSSVNLSGSSTQTITNGNITGSVTYNPSNKTLYLKDATINGGIVFTNLGTSDRYFIYLSGTNKIVSSNHGIRCQNSYVVLSNTSGTPGSSLNIDCSGSSSNYACINAIGSGSHFEVWSTILDMKGKGAGFHGGDATTTLEFVGSYVNVNCEAGAVVKFKTLSYNDAMTTSSGTFTSGQGFLNSSGELTTSFSVRPLLMVGKEAVRTAADSRTGSLYSWKWSKDGKVLEITGDIDAGSWAAIYNYGIPDLVVKASSTYSLNSTTTCVNLWKNTSFEGAGTLKLTSTNYSAISTNYSANVSMKMASMEILGKSYGYNGQMSGSLTLNKYDNNTVYKFAGANEANIFTGHLVMNDMDISTENSYWNPSDGKIYYEGAIDHAGTISSGTWFKSANQISYLALWVGGTHVRENCTDYITSPMITAGTINYDKSSKTLELNNTVFTAPTGDTKEAVVSEIDGLKINITGNVEANTIGDCFYIKAPAEFTGTGKLQATSSENTGLSIYGNTKVTLNVNNELHFEGAKYGYWGHHNNSSHPDCDLVLTKAGTNSDYYFKGTQASLQDASHIVCNDMDYYYSSSYGTPGCYYDLSDHMVKQNGGNVVKESDVNFYQISQKYGIFVGGTEITNCNRSAVGSPAINKPLGVSFNDASQTLYLNNVTINYTPSDTNTGAIQTASGATLNINVTGECTVTSDNAYAALWLRNSTTTIKGDGTLNTAGKWSDIYPMSGGTLTINGDVTVNATNQGITSNNAPDGLIIGGNAVVNAKEISGMNAITLEDGQAIVAPTGAQVSGGNVVVGGSTAQNVVIMKVVEYALEVNSIKVTSANCADILGDGTMSYDDATWTLTMNSVNVPNYDGWSGSFIANTGINGLKIVVTGDNNIQCREGADVIYTNYETALTGTGTLTSNRDFYIVSPGADPSAAKIIIDGPTVEIANVMGWENNETLAVLSGKLTCTTSGTPVSNIEVLDLGEGMYITTPDGGSFSADLKGITLNGSSLYTGKLVIEGATAFDLAITGKTVTTANCNDILGNGVFKYDDATKTLTINGDCSSNDRIVNSYIDGLTINVASNSTLTHTSDETVIRLFAPTTITGGTLTLVSTAPDKDALGIYISDADLLIKDAEINVSGDGFVYGITGNDQCQVVIDNSEISATAHTYGAIYDWNGITLTNCYVEEPRPSQIFTYGIAAANGVVVGSGEASETVVIKKGEDAINGIDAAQAVATDVYDVAGRKLDQTRRGINIVRTSNGKTVKVVKK